MRVMLHCHLCAIEISTLGPYWFFSEYRDDGRYEHTCARGHVTTTILQEQKFETLFQIGANAILDGYYREAVSSFSASLERFYEFALRVFLDTNEVSNPNFESTWRILRNQSERQLGAFATLWLAKIGVPPKLLSEDWIRFRNSVIHKGEIPNKEKAIAYGDAVLDIVGPAIDVLKERFRDQVSKATIFHIIRSRRPEDNGRPVSTLSQAGILNLVVDGVNRKPLSEELISLASTRATRGL